MTRRVVAILEADAFLLARTEDLRLGHALLVGLVRRSDGWSLWSGPRRTGQHPELVGDPDALEVDVALVAKLD